METENNNPSIDWETIKATRTLKARSGEYVIYKVDYLLDHLAREIYLLESGRKARRERGL